jgi:hypothetical protein
MAFTFRDEHITDFYHHGFTVFRGILPPSLVTDLREAGEKIQKITEERRGRIARSPNIASLEADLGPRLFRPFRDYLELRALLDAARRVLTPRHRPPGLENVAIFTTPVGSPSCQDWHRDIDEGYLGVDNAEFRVLKTDPTFLVQVNCAIYSDSCLWYVPGSAGRKNTPGELAAAGKPYDGVEGRGQWPAWETMDYAEAERACIEYCRAMPGAMNLVLEAGDFAMYRPIGWHTGNYAPHRRRMTLHHHITTPETDAWQAARLKAITEVTKKAGSDTAV